MEQDATLEHLLGLRHLTAGQIRNILEHAKRFKAINERKIKKVPTLRGTTVVNFFVEPSTRTRTSFEIAAKRLSADTLSFNASSSSFVKGETLLDTARNIEAMQPEILVLRHKASGAPHMLSKAIDAAIVNAGDGYHEHPTQALLDMFTMEEHKGSISNRDTPLKVAIVGENDVPVPVLLLGPSDFRAFSERLFALLLHQRFAAARLTVVSSVPLEQRKVHALLDFVHKVLLFGATAAFHASHFEELPQLLDTKL